MSYSRPKNLNLFTIHFPIPAVASILHRVSGVVLFLLIPLLLLVFDYSLKEVGFTQIQNWFSNIYAKFLLWLCLISFCFHFVAGIKHLLADIHIGDSLKGGQAASIIVFIITFLLMILMGVWIW